MVIAPASTGKDKSNKIVVRSVAHENRVLYLIKKDLTFIFLIVLIKLVEPKIEDVPAKCNEKIEKSTEDLPWPVNNLKGGYKVQPVPVPVPIKADITKSKIAGGRSQKLMLFSRGKAISGEPPIKGINQLPNPPIMVGITKKKIITNACAVTIEL